MYTDNIWDDSAWSEPVPIDLLGIDQDVSDINYLFAHHQLFFDDDDRVYLCAAMWKTVSPLKDHFEIWGVEIDITTGRSLSRPTLLRKSPLINFCAEGPHIYKKDGWFYLLTAEGGTEIHHRAMIFRSHHPLGPYDAPPDGVNPLVNNAVDDDEVRQTGHADMFEGADGRWWAVLLATRPQTQDLAQLGRETFLVPVEWADGWPVFNHGKRVTTEVTADLPPTPAPSIWRDDFKSRELQRWSGAGYLAHAT